MPTITAEYIRPLVDSDRPLAEGELWWASVEGSDEQFAVQITGSAIASMRGDVVDHVRRRVLFVWSSLPNDEGSKFDLLRERAPIQLTSGDVVH